MKNNIPTHVGIIMDGNGRWATRQGLSRSMGHKAGYETFKKTAVHILKKGVKYLSVFAFSTENFNRSVEEVKYLMDIFVNRLNKECDKIHKENIRIVFAGRKDNLRPAVLNAMEKVTEMTKNNTKGVFNICLNYGGIQEIADATKKIAKEVKEGKLNEEDIDEKLMYKYMYNELPPIDLLIRTSGEQRISNFMMYELSYAELYFTEVKFPSFDREEFEKAIDDFNTRNRRFGGDQK